MKYVIPVVVIVFIGAFVLLKKLGILDELLASKKKPSLPYKKNKYLLSKAERAFYEVLLGAVGSDIVVFTKIRLLDLLYLPKGTENAQTHRNKVQSKHVDFVLCRRDTISPICVIELNDSSHKKASRQERDAFVKAALAAAGLPYLPIPAQRTYDQRKLRQDIRAAIMPSAKADDADRVAAKTS